MDQNNIHDMGDVRIWVAILFPYFSLINVSIYKATLAYKTIVFIRLNFRYSHTFELYCIISASNLLLMIAMRIDLLLLAIFFCRNLSL